MATGVAIYLGLEFRGFIIGILQRDAELIGDHLRETVCFGEGEVVHARDITHDHFGTHGAVGDDVGDALIAVFLPHVVDDIDATSHAEIDIEIRRRYSFRIQKTFEEELKAQRIKISDLEEVGDETPCTRTTAGANGNLLLAGPIDKVPHDEEVVLKAGFADNRKLIVNALTEDFSFLRILRFFRRMVIHAIAFFQAFDTEMFEIISA